MDGLLTAEDIRKVTRDQRTKEGTTGHSSGDTALNASSRTGALSIGVPILWSLVEVAKVGLCRDNGGHGTDIKTEESTANDGDGRDNVL